MVVSTQLLVQLIAEPTQFNRQVASGRLMMVREEGEQFEVDDTGPFRDGDADYTWHRLW